MKKILFLILLILIVFTIYAFTKKEEKLFFSIGEKIGDVYFDKEDMHITEVTTSIEQNELVMGKEIQNILIKSSKIEIDLNRMFYLTTYNRILTQLEDLEELFILIRKYSKETIQVIPLSGSSELAQYTNKKISILCKKYDIIISR